MAQYVIRVMVASLLLLAGAAGAQGEYEDSHVVETVPSGRVDWTAGVVLSSARAGVAGRGGPIASRRAAAFAMAVQAARQRLLEALRQLPLDAERTVGSMLRDAVEKRQALVALVAEADVVRTQYLPRDIVETTMQVPIFETLTSLVWPTLSAVSAPVPEAADGVYTGIVIDARGLAIRQALFPKVVDEDGQTIYAPTHVDVEVAMQRGYMVYTKTLDSAQVTSRVGERPLVIRARRVAGKARVDLLIAKADTARLQRSAATRLLLNQCRVVIVG